MPMNAGMQGYSQKAPGIGGGDPSRGLVQRFVLPALRFCRCAMPWWVQAALRWAATMLTEIADVILKALDDPPPPRPSSD